MKILDGASPLEPTGNRGNIEIMKTLKDMLAEARQVVPEEGPAEVAKRLAAGEKIAVIDVRDPDEFRDGHLEAATATSAAASWSSASARP